MSETASTSRFRLVGVLLALFVLATVGILMVAQQRSLGPVPAQMQADGQGQASGPEVA